MATKKNSAGENQVYDESTGRYGNGFGGKKPKEFSMAVLKAKATQPPERAWRVTTHSEEEFKQEYPNARLHITGGGSAVAVTTDGDIISVCRNENDTMKGYEILELAVKNGGKKLDSYSGNHRFYTRNGFEPVSWCEWNDEFAPPDWKEGRDDREPIIFYKYTGRATNESVDDFIKRITASKDYDEAKLVRDGEIGG